MKKICVIICYFGTLPLWFKLWMISASNNKKIDFLLFTDNDIENDIAENIEIIKMTPMNFCDICKEKINIDIEIKKAYKLCDFKPAYGKIFEDYIKKYEYWGCCDLDLLWGKISDFYNYEDIKQYEKVNWCGHFTLYKNNEEINNLFMMKGRSI